MEEEHLDQLLVVVEVSVDDAFDSFVVDEKDEEPSCHLHGVVAVVVVASVVVVMVIESCLDEDVDVQDVSKIVHDLHLLVDTEQEEEWDQLHQVLSLAYQDHVA